MRALTLDRFGGPDDLELTEVPLPEPGSDEIRVRVAASTINPVDVSTRSGALAGAGLLAERERYGLGWDVAGTVDRVGTNVTRFRAGEPVVGLRDLMFTLPGAHSDFVVLDVGAAAPAPRSVSLSDAATLPLCALTADRSLGLTALQPGQALLVTGAAGGVGGFALELARLRGLRTVAVASPEDESLVRSLGATDFVSRDEELASAVRRLVPGGVDAVIDAAVLGTRAHDALRSEGTFVALVRPFAPPPIRGTRVYVQEVFADGARLAELAAMVDAGLLTLRVAARYPLAEARAAHARFAAGGLRGRVVLTMS